MSEEQVTIEVDGREIPARKGAMLIEATDAAGIYIPRFCYHKHLSVAANCRMCLVDVERAPKPLPACATPVMEGMKVSTTSDRAVDAQRSTMEFLLINHPLDCPICDQGGECELQDLAMGYGGDVSRYSERKRVVRDKDIGPLVQTDMTRCIHCTRCVRFGEEIAGLRELGATGRGEHMEIGTYIAKAMSSELSGNVIDLCPVGALTSKPYRYSARAWELQQRDGVAPHDCVGSNVHFHVKGAVVKRVVPKDNHAVNETWLSDRDRFSYEALNSDQRLTTPRIKRDGEWHDCDWDVAIDAIAERIGHLSGEGSGGQIGALASPSSTTEEFYLLQRMIRELGSNNIDHRPRQIDFSGDAAAPLYPALGMTLEQLETADAIVLVGAHPRHDQPLVNHRIRKAALAGAKVVVINSVDYDCNFPVAQKIIVAPSQLSATLGAIAKSVAGSLPEKIQQALAPFASEPAHEQVAEALKAAASAIVVTGNFAQRQADYGQINALAGFIADATDAVSGQLTDGANAAGAWLAGAVPHRGPGGRKLVKTRSNADTLLDKPLAAYFLLGIEPEFDCLRAQRTIDALRGAFVVAMTAFENPSLATTADVLLPIAAYAENEGTFVNALGTWQTFAPAVRPRGEARAGWKLLRMLGERLSLPGFDAVTCADVTREIEALCEGAEKPSADRSDLAITAPAGVSDKPEAVVEIPLYAGDPLVRRGAALQATPSPDLEAVHVNTATARQLGLKSGGQALIKGDGTESLVSVAIDELVGDGCYLLYAARAGAIEFSGAKHIQISKA
jgi:NADH-quinone oxidoreductase subunit G